MLITECVDGMSVLAQYQPLAPKRATTAMAITASRVRLGHRICINGPAGR